MNHHGGDTKMEVARTEDVGQEHGTLHFGDMVEHFRTIDQKLTSLRKDIANAEEKRAVLSNRVSANLNPEWNILRPDTCGSGPVLGWWRGLLLMHIYLGMVSLIRQVDQVIRRSTRKIKDINNSGVIDQILNPLAGAGKGNDPLVQDMTQTAEKHRKALEKLDDTLRDISRSLLEIKDHLSNNQTNYLLFLGWRAVMFAVACVCLIVLSLIILILILGDFTSTNMLVFWIIFCTTSLRSFLYVSDLLKYALLTSWSLFALSFYAGAGFRSADGRFQILYDIYLSFCIILTFQYERQVYSIPYRLAFKWVGFVASVLLLITFVPTMPAVVHTGVGYVVLFVTLSVFALHQLVTSEQGYKKYTLAALLVLVCVYLLGVVGIIVLFCFNVTCLMWLIITALGFSD